MFNDIRLSDQAANYKEWFLGTSHFRSEEVKKRMVFRFEHKFGPAFRCIFFP